MVKTNGDHLDNDESKEMAKIGDQWVNSAGKQYKYYKAFEGANNRNTPEYMLWSNLWRL